MAYPNGKQGNQVALYTCDDGYVLKGPDRLRCNVTGHWTPDAPVCEASGKCLIWYYNVQMQYRVASARRLNIGQITVAFVWIKLRHAKL